MAFRRTADLLHLSAGRFHGERRDAGQLDDTATVLAGGSGRTASEHTGLIVAIGESIMDGSINCGSQRPIDRPTRPSAAGATRSSGHGRANEGLAGNRLLHDSLGPNALARFDRDVLAQTGVTHVIVQAGANDIFTLNPVEEVTVEDRAILVDCGGHLKPLSLPSGYAGADSNPVTFGSSGFDPRLRHQPSLP